MTAASNSESRKREAERAEQAARSQKSALGAPNSPEAGSDASGSESAILSAEQREALSAAIKDSFYEARDHGRTMHQAAEDERIFEAALAIVREHRAEVLAEVERRIQEVECRREPDGRIGVGCETAIRIVRDYRQEQNHA